MFTSRNQAATDLTRKINSIRETFRTHCVNAEETVDYETIDKLVIHHYSSSRPSNVVNLPNNLKTSSDFIHNVCLFF